MKVILCEDDGTVIEQVRLSESDGRVPAIRAFEDFCSVFAEVDDNFEPKWIR